MVATLATGGGAITLGGCAELSRDRYSAGSDTDSEWPMAGYDAGNSAFVPDAAAPRDAVSIRWRTELPVRPSQRPVVTDGTVFVPTRAGLLALDSENGEERWRAGGEHELSTAPVVHDGTVYVGRDGQPGPAFRALDAADGTEVWTYRTRDAVRAPPVADIDDGELRAVYVGDSSGRVYEFTPDGTVEHRIEVFAPITRLAFRSQTGPVVGTRGGGIYAFHDAGDRLQGLWRRTLDGKVRAIAIPSPGRFTFVATAGGPEYRLDVNGTPDWTRARSAIHHLVATDHDMVSAGPGGLAVRDDDRGDPQWKADERFHASPAVAGDRLVAGGGDLGGEGYGFVAGYAMDPRPTAGLLGRRRWRFETDSAVVAGVTVADGAVFAATQGIDGPSRLYALE